eukprot:CAMPEP_0115669000 /NCGR_PEP_ID=MMETSP0272-20121206/50767_1 /TAXON_ID=71861 /ORGANISM="Scrippsiella trochoidea, Strain CCMP3099" /LENGTH=109 /DNA_ID=CAMNT_0003107639 /DNA_START=288 /DNA_END=617 /DNA_ORIENTATION=+
MTLWPAVRNFVENASEPARYLAALTKNARPPSGRAYDNKSTRRSAATSVYTTSAPMTVENLCARSKRCILGAFAQSKLKTRQSASTLLTSILSLSLSSRTGSRSLKTTL